MAALQQTKHTFVWFCVVE